MKPFLRPLDSRDPVPDGWVVEPAGEWHGRPVEVAYDVRRHQVMLARNSAVDDCEAHLAATGWEYQGTDGLTSIWVKDRLEVARQRLAADPPAMPEPSTGLAGPEL